jgi:Kdo2-lipid IVA lauroyltransferase/acyltransferase
MSEETDPSEGQRVVWNKGRKRRRSPLRKTILRNLRYVVLRILHAVICRLPRPVGRCVSWTLGTLAYYVLARERSIALDGLTRVYGAGCSPREIRRMAREVFRNAVHAVVDWLILRRWSRERLERRFPEVVTAFRDRHERYRALGTGVVGISAHFGNWEVLSLFLGHFMPNSSVPVAKRLYFPRYQAFLHRLRTSSGNDIIYTDESPRRILRAIREGKIVGFLPDQDVRTNSGVFVDFFGLPAYTVTVPVQLARKLEVPILVILVIRKGSSFELVLSERIDVAHTDDEDADLLSATQDWTRYLEDQIRRAPEQWCWMHPRWRTKPGAPRRRVSRSGGVGRRPD